MKNIFDFIFNQKWKINKKFKAFTVAELVTVISVVGFVSIFTLGTVVKQFETQKNEVRSVIVNNDFAVSLADMHADGNLTNVQNDLEFAKNLQKYFNVSGDVLNNQDKVATANGFATTNDNFKQFASKNFASSYVDEQGNSIKATDYNIVLKTTTGASIALTYNKDNCNISEKFVTDSSTGGLNGHDYRAKNQALTCVEGIYDVNGPAGPNKIGLDVGFFNEIKGNCTGKFLMDSNGKCSICSITSANCRAENKTLDEKNCKCQCTRKCPTDMKLDTDTCTCKCKNVSEFNPLYCKMPEDNSYSCKPVLIKQSTPAKCTLGGGKWDQNKCDCTCDAEKCASDSNNFGTIANDPDRETFCNCLCRFKEEDKKSIKSFKEEVRNNAINDKISDEALLKEIVAHTFPANYGMNASAGCITCKKLPDDDNQNIIYTLANGYCAPGCSADAEKNCNTKDGFFKWLPHNPKDPTNSCKCVCNKESMNKKLNKLKDSIKKLVVLDMSEPSSTVWSVMGQAVSYSNGTCSKSSCCGCTYCSTTGDNTSVKKVVSLANNSGKISDGDVKYTFNEEACAFELDDSQLKDSIKIEDLKRETHFHGWCGNWFGWRFKSPKWSKVKLDNPNAKRPTNIEGYSSYDTKDFIVKENNSYWNKELKLSMTYDKWNDPIVLNYTSCENTLGLPNNKSCAIQNHITSKDSEKIEFPLVYDDGKYSTVKTHWLKTKDRIEDSHLFLVTLDDNGNVPNISFLFSDQVPNINDTNTRYSTGLQQLEIEFDTKVDPVSESAIYVYDTGLINKNDEKFDKLYAWYDIGTKGKVDNKSKEIFSMDDLKIIEINTNVIVQTNESGEVVKNQNAVYGISGEYKRLVPYNTKHDSWPFKGEYKACHVKPFYDAEGKQILNTWELDTNNSNKDICKHFFVEKDDHYLINYAPKKADSGRYNETWLKYGDETKVIFDGNDATDDMAFSLQIPITKLWTIKGKHYTEKIFNLNDIVFSYDD